MYKNFRDFHDQRNLTWPVHHATTSDSDSASIPSHAHSRSEATVESFYTGVNTTPPSIDRHDDQEGSISTVTGSFQTAFSFRPPPARGPLEVGHPDRSHDLHMRDYRHSVNGEQPTFDLTDSTLNQQVHITQLRAGLGSLTGHGAASRSQDQDQGVAIGIPMPRFRVPERQKHRFGGGFKRSFGDVPSKAQVSENLLEASFDANIQPHHHVYHSQRSGEATVDVNALHSEMIQLRQQVDKLKSMINANNMSQANPIATAEATLNTGRPSQGLDKKSRTRPVKRLVFMAAVRQELDDLLGNPKKINFTRLAMREEVEAFEAVWRSRRDNSLECCQIDNFKVDLYTNPSSGWNNSAGWVFARHYVSKFETDSTAKEIQRYFIIRMRSLKRSFKLFLESDEEKAKLQKYHRRKNRKKDKYARRLKICEEEPLARPHLGLIQGLGPDGMSSEDSDYPESPDVPLRIPSVAQYVVLRPIWRAPEVTVWIYIFDLLWAHKRDIQDDGRGKQPVFRIRMTHTTSANPFFKVVQDLPRNVYDIRWIASSEGEYTRYNPTLYNFNYSPGLVE